MTTPNPHAFEIPGVRLVLVITGNIRQFEHHFQIRTQIPYVQFGRTGYRCANSPYYIRGHDPATTRFMLVGEYWLKSDLIDEVSQYYEQVRGQEPPRPQPESWSWVESRGREVQTARRHLTDLFRSEYIGEWNASPPHEALLSPPPEHRTGVRPRMFASGEPLMYGRGTFSHSPPSRIEIPSQTIGDTSCANNAKSPFLRCAVNPCGPCEGCKDYESNAQRGNSR
jgi:hypothetical protein